MYLALLKVGESSVGAIIQTTGYHRDLVYGALQRLEQQGLAQSLEKKKIRHYQAVDPAVLKRQAVAKQKLADYTVPKLQKILKELPVAVQIFEGAAGLEALEQDWATTLKDNEEFYCIGGAGDAWYSVAEDFFRPYHRRLVKRGIQLKTVTFANEIKGIQSREIPGFNVQRVLPSTFDAPSSTIIYGDKVLLQIFGEQYIGILIRSKAASSAYRKYFKALWSVGKPASGLKD